MLSKASPLVAILATVLLVLAASCSSNDPFAAPENEPVAQSTQTRGSADEVAVEPELPPESPLSSDVGGPLFVPDADYDVVDADELCFAFISDITEQLPKWSDALRVPDDSRLNRNNFSASTGSRGADCHWYDVNVEGEARPVLLSVLLAEDPVTSSEYIRRNEECCLGAGWTLSTRQYGPVTAVISFYREDEREGDPYIPLHNMALGYLTVGDPNPYDDTEYDRETLGSLRDEIAMAAVALYGSGPSSTQSLPDVQPADGEISLQIDPKSAPFPTRVVASFAEALNAGDVSAAQSFIEPGTSAESMAARTLEERTIHVALLSGL